jgi:hypothetical protein
MLQSFTLPLPGSRAVFNRLAVRLKKTNETACLIKKNLLQIEIIFLAHIFF